MPRNGKGRPDPRVAYLARGVNSVILVINYDITSVRVIVLYFAFAVASAIACVFFLAGAPRTRIEFDNIEAGPRARPLPGLLLI